MPVPTALVTLKRTSLVGLALLLVIGPAASALAEPVAEATATHSYGEMVQYDLVFPVQGPYTLSDTFYAARSDGDHHAQDIMSNKMTPIVAVAAGTIRYVNWSSNPSDLRPERCCTLAIRHDDGWESRYIHMNNDTPGTDDGLGWGIADGILPGVRVDAGQLVGWVGDSGNAEYTGSHLHFELADPAGVIVNPYQALLAAADASCGNDCYPFVTLVLGSRGSAVVQLQTMLDSLGHDPGPIDGVFGSLTRSAVQAFESTAGLTVDGVVDEITWEAIVAEFEGSAAELKRLYGSDRYATAVSIASASHPDGADVVFIAVGTNFPDAIAAGPAAAHLGAPILLVQRDGVPGPTRTALTDLDPATVVILGGPVAISAAVETSIRQLLPTATVTRLAGADRYRTAVEISGFAFTDGADTVYVATGLDYPDAIAAAPAAIEKDASILLIPSTGVTAAIRAELLRLTPSRIVIVGSTSSVSTATATQLGGYAASIERISGANRYAMSAAVSAATFPVGTSTVYIAVGTDFADALAGGPATIGSQGPILFVTTSSISSQVADEIRRLRPTRIVIFGGPAAVADTVAVALRSLPTSPAPDLGDYVYDPAGGVEQWRPLVEEVFALWGLDTTTCGTGDRADDCVGSQVDNALIIMACESSGNPTVVNSVSGTTGLFQHRPSYWDARTNRVRALFPSFPTNSTPLNPEHNVMVAALLVSESRDALIGANSLTGPWDDGPQPWGHWDSSSRYCADPPLVSP